MTPETVMTTAREALWLTLQLATPLLLVALAVGVVVGIVQAATQINEMTLSFIPKLLAIAAVIVALGPWMLHALVEYTRHLIESIPVMLN
ncbi:flagellar biosynthesis protein FliQ [Solimonas marina]|uniref:Flagellar biosynthetic protein FliQ n=1 Tax=Solimonas marina TaxID=2714601 RepID=A0A969W6R9_9GAMM|nr:flagellar biosynthesis protein FliQ [Solimonas marina]NKF21701.1 flagellar biosynthesis protein FliQ [Solimonas marina]